jgi:hypothetical protein
VAYTPAVKPSSDEPNRRGRPKTYGDKIPTAKMLRDANSFSYAKSPIYGKTGVTLSYRHLDLLWRPVGVIVRFLIVRHPTRGSIFLMATDLNLSPLDLIGIYGLRFKIEVSFKQSLRVIGTFAYHFWMAPISPIKRKSGNQHLHMKTDAYRKAVRSKLTAYPRHIQLGLIAQGLLQILSATVPEMIWRS